MSSVYTSSSIEDVFSLDRPLVVKCTFDQKKKRITFGSARNCSYDILRQKVERCFPLTNREYQIIWRDDDMEEWPIMEDEDLGEAIAFFGSEEQPPNSGSSLLSGYSSGSSGKKITVQVTIRIDYDGPSLSETSSIASREEYDLQDEQSSIDLSSISRSELEDDEITVSSKNTSSGVATKRQLDMATPETIHAMPTSLSGSDFASLGPEEDDDTRTESQYLSGPFERLKLGDPPVNVDPGSSLLRSERGAAWLRDQTTRTIKSMLGALPEPSDKSIDAGGSQIDDSELSLEKDPRGKYYYSYTSSGTSSSFDSGYEETPSVIERNMGPPKYRPTSMELAWFESQEQGSSSHSRPVLHNGFKSDPGPPRDFAYSGVPPEVLPYITSAMIPQPEELTTCSHCDIVLDSIRYVCSTCREKKPRSLEEIEASWIQGKGKDPWANDLAIAYPPPRHRTLAPVDVMYNYGYPRDEKPVPLLPDGTPDPGYELCPNCLESAGVDHALESSLAPGSSPSPTSPENALSIWRRTAPERKGQLRHAYFEKSWGLNGWQDVQQDELCDAHCSTCNSTIHGRRYKCASCVHFNLCRACFSQVHEIHPSHAFLVILDRSKASISRSEPGTSFPTLESSDLPSMKHPDVRCSYCLLDIVGARFHCVVCELVDICSNCESAGLPGNLDSSDGGHNSSHIMMKIPYPLETAEVQAASHRAVERWNGGDADNAYGTLRPRSRTNSWDGTVRVDSTDPQIFQDHGVRCDACSQQIMGNRYQCGNCPSLPVAYNLCSSCEQKSYVVHDSNHIFFKFPRPVDRPVESVLPILPRLYKHRVGPSNGMYDPQRPKEYLNELIHATAYCDLCVEQIVGEWFRCVYCEKDLCQHCEPMDTHDKRHFFVVFKAAVEMEQFLEHFGQPDASFTREPVIPIQVYNS